jgi:single-strand DNA-binding protein
MADLRMPDINEVRLAGHLCGDPELKYTANKMAVAKFALAVNRRYRTKDGEQKEETAFIACTVWGQPAEYAAQHSGKGRAALVEGRLMQETWTGKDGERREKLAVTVTRFQPLDWAKDGQHSAHKPAPERPPERQPELQEHDDDVPF